MRYALIPAAGKSRRMGRPKVSLPLGGRVVLEHVIVALKQAGIEDILVVLGGIVPQEDIPKLKEQGVAEVFLPGTSTQDITEFIRSHVKPRE